MGRPARRRTARCSACRRALGNSRYNRWELPGTSGPIAGTRLECKRSQWTTDDGACNAVTRWEAAGQRPSSVGRSANAGITVGRKRVTTSHRRRIHPVCWRNRGPMPGSGRTSRATRWHLSLLMMTSANCSHASGATPGHSCQSYSSGYSTASTSAVVLKPLRPPGPIPSACKTSSTRRHTATWHAGPSCRGTGAPSRPIPTSTPCGHRASPHDTRATCQRRSTHHRATLHAGCWASSMVGTVPVTTPRYMEPSGHSNRHRNGDYRQWHKRLIVSGQPCRCAAVPPQHLAA